MNTIEQLNTGYFATVMATGIISIALLFSNYFVLSKVFFYIALSAYIILIIIYASRMLYYPREVWADLRNANRVFGYFTYVAATNVLGARFAFASQYNIALVLGVVGVVCWGVLTYYVLMFLLFYNQQPASKVLNGTWLLTTVATESVADLASTLASFVTEYHTWLLFLSYVFWSVGIVLYLIFIALIVNQFFFHTINPSDLNPPYWINMGAVAITTLVGTRLILYPESTQFLIFVQPFVQGFTMLLWAWGTWWIPFLALMFLWKYMIFKQPFVYDPSLWSAVFPLGMYTAATYTLSNVQGLHMLHAVIPLCLWVSVTAWTLVAMIFLNQVIRTKKPLPK
jgi:tellurite resistance protein TehA-like permease